MDTSWAAHRQIWLEPMMNQNQSPHDEVEKVARRLISLAQAAEISGLSPSHLRLLVGRGVIWGQKIGRNWVTTEEAVREYVARGVRRGPKTKDRSGQQ
jgi:hypothetical protein